jgi:hypothetical protein
LLLEATAIGVGLTLLVGRELGWRRVTSISQLWASVGLNAWWAVPLATLALPLAIDVARGLFALLLGWVRVPRAATTALGALTAGALLCFGYFPALANQLSPKEAFETYRRLRQPGEAIGVLGVRDRSARFYAAGDVDVVSNADSAARFLSGEGRRWLVFRHRHLGELNAAFRAPTGENVPVLDARSQDILLASNDAAGGVSVNPLDPYVLSRAPTFPHPVDAELEGRITALGWSIVDGSGDEAPYVVPAHDYRMRFGYRVDKPLRKRWKAFLHIDGYGRRHIGDHEVVGGLYDTTLWRPGDVIVDEVLVRLEPTMLPGRYTVYYGFFIRGDERLKVSRGLHHDHRVTGGTLEVR